MITNPLIKHEREKDMYCKNCGKEIPNYSKVCGFCGKEQVESSESQGGLVCPNCSSKNISVQIQQSAGRTSTKNKGCLYGIGRAMLIICTCGLWLVFGKKKETSKTVFVNTKVAICQNCGHSWTIEKSKK